MTVHENKYVYNYLVHRLPVMNMLQILCHRNNQYQFTMPTLIDHYFIIIISLIN